MNQWEQAQAWESAWWGNCANTYGEEEKQLLYARKMGLRFFHDTKSPYAIDVNGLSIVDIGGGAVSLLLKCQNLKNGMVVDPCAYPAWVWLRYVTAGIKFLREDGETFDCAERFDEAWIYNCLQHTRDPRQVIENAKRKAKLIRLFEWIETGTNEGHPHAFTAPQLNDWLGGEGKTEMLSGENGCFGKCYYGIFRGGAE